MFGIQDYHKATWGQNFVASVAGAVASITVAAPLDTVKTRIQNANFETNVPGRAVLAELIRNEGPAALFKGLTPKVSASLSHSCISFFVGMRALRLNARAHDCSSECATRFLSLAL